VPGHWTGRWVLARRDQGPTSPPTSLEGLERYQVELDVDAGSMGRTVEASLPPEVLQAAHEQGGFVLPR